MSASLFARFAILAGAALSLAGCGINSVPTKEEDAKAKWADVESAYQRQAPILLWIYAPHWAPAKYKGEWVEFPEYTKECYDDPKWGINPDMAYDCGKPHGEIWKVGWVGVKDKWPGAYKAIKAFTIDNDEMGKMITEVDLSIPDADTFFPPFPADDWVRTGSLMLREDGPRCRLDEYLRRNPLAG